MTELLEANERSQAEQGMPDSKKQDEKMQIGIDSIDSFAAQFADKGESVNASASKSVRQLVERIEFADQVGLDVFGVGEHHRREFLVLHQQSFSRQPQPERNASGSPVPSPC